MSQKKQQSKQSCCQSTSYSLHLALIQEQVLSLNIKYIYQTDKESLRWISVPTNYLKTGHHVNYVVIGSGLRTDCISPFNGQLCHTVMGSERKTSVCLSSRHYVTQVGGIASICPFSIHYVIQIAGIA